MLRRHLLVSYKFSCLFARFVCRDQPVHLYDAYTGQIRATYRPYNSLDELDSPSSLCFLNDGQHLITGGFRKERELQIFDLSRPYIPMPPKSSSRKLVSSPILELSSPGR